MNRKTQTPGDTSLALAAACFPGLLLCLLPGAVAAQESGQHEAIDEIIVTARYREETLQDVGQSIAAFTGPQIEAAGLTDFSDIIRRTPSLNAAYRGPNSSTPSIRGLATTNPLLDTLSAPQMIGIYYDDIPITTKYASQRDVPFVDIARVEILRGPQGTLYGEGAMGGAIRYVGGDPDLSVPRGRFHWTASQIDSGQLGYNVDATIGAPIMQDRLGLQVSTWVRDDGGFINFTQPGLRNGNGFETRGARAVLLAQPSEALRIRLFALHDNSELSGEWAVTGRPKDMVNDFRPFSSTTDDKLTLAGLRMDYETPIGSIQSITGYFQRRFDRFGFDSGVAMAFGPFLPVFGITDPADPSLDLNNKERSLSTELRFVSSLGGPFDFAAGVFYKDMKYRTAQMHEMPVAAHLVPFFGSPLTDIHFTRDDEHIAVFGEAYYALTQTIRLIAGLRWFRNEIDDLLNASGGSLLFPVPIVGAASDTSLSTVLPKFAIEGKVADSVLLYAQASKGARSGGINSPVSIASLPAEQQADAAAFDEDSIWAYEAGLKSTFLDRRVLLNFALFYNDWKDAQINLLTPAGLGYTANVGRVDIRGAELETHARLGRGFDIFAAVGYLRAETDGDIALGGPENTVVPDGSPVPFVPKWNTVAGGSWTVPLSGQARLISRAEYVWVADSVSSLGNVAETDSSGLLNLRSTLDFDGLALTAFVTNVGNQVRATAFDGASESFINRPRTVGLTLRYGF